MATAKKKHTTSFPTPPPTSPHQNSIFSPISLLLIILAIFLSLSSSFSPFKLQSGNSINNVWSPDYVFSFSRLWAVKKLPAITRIDVIHYSPSFSIEKIYNEGGKTLPKIIRGTTDMSTFPPHSSWKDLSSTNSYLYKTFENDSEAVSIVTETRFLRGTDAFSGQHPKMKIIEGKEGMEWLFGGKTLQEENRGRTAYMGLIDIRNFPSLQSDLQVREWRGLGRVGLGWVGLGWVGLGWVGEGL